MRLATTRLAVLVIMLALAGCGGAQVTVNDVPGGPVDLKVPGTGEGLAPQATPTATATPTETPADGTAQATPTPATGTTGQTPATSGAQATPTPAAGTTGQQPPGSGSGQNALEDYCAQNPGAC